MKLIKKLVSVLVVCTTVFSFAACGSGDKDKVARELDIETPVTVNVWYDNRDYESYLNTVASGMKEANSLVTVNPVYVESEEIIDTIYNETVRNDNAPDVYFMSSENCDKAYLLGLMLENNSYSDIYNEQIYGNAAIKACSYKGKLYGYPVSFDMPVMVYNKKYAQSVDTFAQIKDISDNYKVTGDNANVSRVFNFNPSSMLLNYCYVGRYMNIGGNDAEDASIFDIDELKFKQAVKEYAALKDAFGIDRSEVSTKECISEFTQDKLLYTIVNVSDLQEINDSGVDYGIIPVPSLSDSLESVPMSVTTMVIVNPYTDTLGVSQAVARTISYDYAEELQKLSGHISARADLLDKSKNADNTDYEMLHNIYSNSIVKAKYVGIQNIYTQYEILLHKVWDGTNIDEAYNEFYKSVENYRTASK